MIDIFVYINNNNEYRMHFIKKLTLITFGEHFYNYLILNIFVLSIFFSFNYNYCLNNLYSIPYNFLIFQITLFYI